MGFSGWGSVTLARSRLSLASAMNYADQMAEVLAGFQELVTEPPKPLPSASLPCPRPATRFERRGERLGHEITDLVRYRRA